MVTNSLQNQQKKASGAVFEYTSNGEKVKLSAGMVKKYLVSGDAAKVTDQEVMMFLTLCKYQHLNPFLREAYLVKYGSSPATIVTGKETFTKRAAKNPNYMGKQAGIICYDPETGNITNREGTFKYPYEQIIGGWAKVFIKDREPEYITVDFEEYAGKTKEGALNRQWASKPATMIRKVAVVQALREAFPDDFGAMYSPEEMSNANPDIDVNEIISEDDKPIMVDEQETTEEIKPEPADAASALFG